MASGYAAWRPEWIRAGKRRLKVSTGKPYCWYHRKVKRGDPIIAHRRLPCGTRVYVKVVGRDTGAWVQVGDRGPYGACAKMSDLRRLQRRLKRKLTIWKNPWCHRYGKDWVWYIKRRARWPGKYRGIADISHTARRLIKHNGWQHVTLHYWHPRSAPKRVAQAVPGLALVDAHSATRDRRGQRRGEPPSLPMGALGQASSIGVPPELFDWRPKAVLQDLRTLLYAVATADRPPVAW